MAVLLKSLKYINSKNPLNLFDSQNYMLSNCLWCLWDSFWRHFIFNLSVLFCFLLHIIVYLCLLIYLVSVFVADMLYCNEPTSSSTEACLNLKKINKNSTCKQRIMWPAEEIELALKLVSMFTVSIDVFPLIWWSVC